MSKFLQAYGTKQTENLLQLLPDGSIELNDVKIYGGWEDDEDRNLELRIYERLCKALELERP